MDFAADDARSSADPGVVAAESQPRIVSIGVASDSHFGDPVAGQSGGYLRGSHRMVNHGR
jgi:hypothetical protein